MPVSISGMASGMDVDALIQKLLKVEARPIRQLELRKKDHSIKKGALRKLGKHLKDIDAATRDLYGFRASYFDKVAKSTDSSAFTIKANKNAAIGTKKIQVIRIATAHKISTDPIKEKDTLPAGTFKIEVNGESHVIKFQGGTLKRLREKIEDTASDIVATGYINTAGDKYIITLQSKVIGEKGEIMLSGDREFLKKIGLVDGKKGTKMRQVAITFDQRYLSPYSGEMELDKQDGSISVNGDGSGITMKGLLWREYTLPVPSPVEKDSELVFNFSLDKGRKISDEDIPGRIEAGPKERTNIKGIILKGYNISRIRKIEKKKEFDSLAGIGVVAEEDGKRIEKIYPVIGNSRTYRIPMGKDFADKKISKILFYCNRGVAGFSKTRIATPIKRKGELEAANEITEPGDAKLKVDGIEITRDRNKGLNDVIKGLTLDLLRPTRGEAVITIDQNLEKSVDKIKKFVEAFNKYVDYSRNLTRTTRVEKGDETEPLNKESGLFVGDSTLMRLESLLKLAINSAYPNRADKPIKLFTQMGVSTGKINANWNSIKSGKLIIDEPVLEKVIRENPEGVLLFFGSDTDGDNRMDTGMAYKLENVLRPYVMAGNNIIANKIQLETTSIKLANERIKRHQDHLQKYEEKLRKKFSRMERSISESKYQRNWMNQQFGNMNSGKDKKE